MMRYLTALLLSTILLLPVPGGANTEIRYLLSQVRESECIFSRNGKDYVGPEAERHLQRKYNYSRSRIKSSIQFIDHIGSKSSITGKKYLVRCGERLLSANQWFHEVLENYRKTSAQ